MDLEYVGHVLARLRPLIRDGELRRSRLERVLAAGAEPAGSVRSDVQRMLAKVGVTIVDDLPVTSAGPEPAATRQEVSSRATAEVTPNADSAEVTKVAGAEDDTVDGVGPATMPRSEAVLTASRADHRAAAVFAARRLLSADAVVPERHLQKRLLTAEHEVGLALLMRGGPDACAGDVTFGGLSGEARQAAEALFMHNQRLVHKLSQKYPATGMAYEDLVQFGFLGLIRAVEKFDPTAGFKFSTYATWWIRQSITRGIADHARLIRFPVYIVERLQKVWRSRDQLTIDGQPPSVHALALTTGFTDDQVREAIRLGRFEPLSLDLPVGTNGETTLGDLLDLADDGFDPSHEVEFMLLQEQLQAVLDTLSEREAGVIAMRFGLADAEPKTLDEIGKVYGVTRERIRQIQEKTMRKLEHPSRSQVLKDYRGSYIAGQVLTCEPGEYAPRHTVRYQCQQYHAFDLTLYVAATVPDLWTCPRCGRDARRLDPAEREYELDQAGAAPPQPNRRAEHSPSAPRMGFDGRRVLQDIPHWLFDDL
ncbi:RNA polymerase sigma factor [Nocardioides panacihumi]|uniref:RNA polymerase sigma factor n=1 Tax=Nocardioides panacihumi TaxID=400774 RepID=A0ABN2QN78_9ACTN